MLARRLIRSTAVALLCCVPAAVPAARAGAPPPLSNPAYGFPLPGDFATPGNAASAGLALSDRWLGESAYENPAASVKQGVEISPLFQRVNRQDLAARNRSIDQTQGFVDAAGVSLSLPLPLKHWGLVLYAWQPVLRLEEQGYQAGSLVSPAAVQQQAAQREIRGGVAVSRSVGEAARVGVAGEWVHRDDSYETHERSGSPSAGDRVLGFKGDAWGGSAGVSWAKDPDRPWGSWFGAAVHYGSELNVTGSLDSRLALGDTTFSFEATRAAEWSGGASARITVAPATRIVAGVSARSGADWKGFDFGTTGGASYGIGLDWKDAELPCGARFGVGQEANPGAVERRAGLLSAGFTWVSGDLVIDVGLLHRNLAREGSPNSSDDLVVASVRVGF
jgi:hypothetical protein